MSKETQKEVTREEVVQMVETDIRRIQMFANLLRQDHFVFEALCDVMFERMKVAQKAAAEKAKQAELELED